MEDYNYRWNEWDMRREVLQMVNIRNMRTVDCQTDQSAFKVDFETQTRQKSNKAVMTKKDNGNNPIWPRNYILGLRTRKMN